jgi:hypothetical protein
VKTMAEVIDAINYERPMDLSASNVKALAYALMAAGFGPVKAAAAGALRDAANMTDPKSPSLFMLDLRSRHALRDRAATLEADQ